MAVGTGREASTHLGLAGFIRPQTLILRTRSCPGWQEQADLGYLHSPCMSSGEEERCGLCSTTDLYSVLSSRMVLFWPSCRMVVNRPCNPIKNRLEEHSVVTEGEDKAN
jgi:hypothetical protein